MPQSGETISVLCACGKKLKAPASAIGRKAKCPACANILTIEAPPPPPPPEPEDDAFGAMYDLADAEQQAAQSNQVDDAPRCPKCATSLEPGAVLCVSCGYDFRSKSKVASKKAPAVSPLESLGSQKKQPLNYKDKDTSQARESGNFFLGVAFGVLFALGGAIVYGLGDHFLGEIPFLGRFIGWSVLGIGYLAGMGVDKGYKGGNAFAGITAAGITLVIVLVTKFVVIAALFAPAVKQALDDVASDRDPRVTEMVRDEAITRDGKSPHAIDEDEAGSYEEKAHARVKSMSKSEYGAYAKKADAYEAREEIFDAVQADIAKERKLDPENIPAEQEAAVDKEAEKRIAAMNDSAVQQRLKVLEAADAKLADEFKQKLADSAKSHGGGDESEDGEKGGGGLSGSLIGFGIVLGLLVLVWLLLPTLIAMLVAYKVAANA